jgi:hypothetical protein
MPAASAAIPLVAVLCATPLATVGGGWWALYAIPVIAAVYIVVTRTTADATQVTAHALLGAKRMTWSDMDGLELRDARWTVAVGKDGRRLPLPMIRPRDLPRLAAASGGSLNLDPQPAVAEDTVDDDNDGHDNDGQDNDGQEAVDDSPDDSAGEVKPSGDVANGLPPAAEVDADDDEGAVQDVGGDADQRGDGGVMAEQRGAGHAGSG